MKKSFLIMGLVAGLVATNGYADTEVARAGKVTERVLTKASGDDKGESKLTVNYRCPERCEVSLLGAEKDDSENNVTREYAVCYYTSNGSYCGVPRVEAVGDNGTVNYGKKPRDGHVMSPEEQIEADWVAGGGYYDENGNPVNPGKKPR